MADEIRTLKEFMTGVTIYAGAIFDNGQIIPTNTNFSLSSEARIGGTSAGMGAWVFEELTMTIPTGASYAGGVSFRAYNQQRIDLTGYLQTGSAVAPLGSASQRASVPQLPSRWDNRKTSYNLTYMRDYTIWSVEPLTDLDRAQLYASGITRSGATPNMPNVFASGGSMSTTQMLSSQTRYYVADGSLSGRVGWLREMFNQQGGMGETAAAPHIYVTRVIGGQISTPSSDEVLDATGSPSTNAWGVDKFWLCWPPSWEILNVGVIEPDELEYLTYMQRSVLAPSGR